MSGLRIGIDLGGTKAAAVLMDAGAHILARARKPTPFESYEGQIDLIADLVAEMEAAAGQTGLPVGIGHPGAISRATGRIKNANSLCLNGQPLKEDLQARLGREIRMANDANCLAVSEASDGAAAGHAVVFAVILGTGCGGGIAVNGLPWAGPNAIGGEWGHNPLPWPRPEWDETPGPRHWDGQHGSIEAYCSGRGLARDHHKVTGDPLTGEQIVARAAAGDGPCNATLGRFEDRLARGLASVINLLDPEVIVVGGGLSRIERLYRHVPALWDQWVFSDEVRTRLLPAMHGDSSGVRGAAWLWPA
jgi:fructokinase|tara:strand:- start:9470 stop:10384 length:915 start_codon:yes stop_codon:yes gene_type:complete